MKIKVQTVTFPLRKPLEITGYSFAQSNSVHVTLEYEEHIGKGEAIGVYFLGETVESMSLQINALSGVLGNMHPHDCIQHLLPPGGARNALDCALWDLRAKLSGQTIWTLTGVEQSPLQTFSTIGIGSVDEMAEAAQETSASSNIKIKLDDVDPVKRVRAVRAVRPSANLIIDVNQGWDFDQLKNVAPAMAELGVAMIEQPLGRGHDEALEGYASPVPLCADESCLQSAEIEEVSKRYSIVNIKLDKTGGLTEALKLADRAEQLGLDLMVGNMCGSSLSMAPAMIVAQRCKFVDLDGPLFIKNDVAHGLSYSREGKISALTSALWG